MKVFYSNRYDTLRDYEQGVPFFEEIFSDKTWNEYRECWLQLAEEGVESIKCKTRDAILSIPTTLNVEILRVGQAVVGSRKGKIIVTPCPMDIFMMLETG